MLVTWPIKLFVPILEFLGSIPIRTGPKVGPDQLGSLTSDNLKNGFVSSVQCVTGCEWSPPQNMYGINSRIAIEKGAIGLPFCSCIHSISILNFVDFSAGDGKKFGEEIYEAVGSKDEIEEEYTNCDDGFDSPIETKFSPSVTSPR